MNAKSPSPAAATPAAPIRLEQLYRAHFAFVWRTLRRYGVPEASLDDATQEVFLVVRRRLTDFRADASERAWLHGIARRVAHDQRRSAERRRRRLELVEPPPASESPELRAQKREAAALVEAFVSQLDEANREVFILRWIEGLGGREIAAALELNENTVYARARRTRKRFERFVARATEPRSSLSPSPSDRSPDA